MNTEITLPLYNQLLSMLPEHELEPVLPHLHAVQFQHGDVLYDPGRAIEVVYFPQHCALSALTVMEDGSAIEVGTIGKEGAAGLSVIAEIPLSLHRVVAQVPGPALKISATVLSRLAQREEGLRERLLKYQAYFLAQISQSVACNGLHPIQRRCCRWLLMTHDRLDNDVIPLTHEFLAMMLGVRRAGVTEVLQSLQQAGLIANQRGKITVIDRQGLEELCCECYRRTTKTYQQLLG